MTPEKLTELSNFWVSRVILTAAELGIFGELQKPSRVDDIAKSKNLDQRALVRLLNALVAVDILSLDKDKFAIKDELKAALGNDPGKSILPGLMHSAHLWKKWSHLTEIIRSGKNAHEPEHFPDFIRAMAVAGMRSSGETVKALDLKNVTSVLDIGGGPGLYAAEFCNALPDARVCVLDMPGAGEIGREFLSERSHENRVHYIAGDALDVETRNVTGADGSGKFDLIFMSNLIHSMKAAEVKRLYRRCADWITPGGRVVVKDFFLDDSRTNPPRSALFSINMLINTDGGDCYTWSETEVWLKEAGFSCLSKITLSDKFSGMVIVKA